MSMPELEFVACPQSSCGGQWLPRDKVWQLRQSHKTFYCPAGHSQFFGQQSEVEQLQAKVKRLEKEIEYFRNLYETEKRKRHALLLSRAAYRGVATKLKKASLRLVG